MDIYFYPPPLPAPYPHVTFIAFYLSQVHMYQLVDRVIQICDMGSCPVVPRHGGFFFSRILDAVRPLDQDGIGWSLERKRACSEYNGV